MLPAVIMIHIMFVPSATHLQFPTLALSQMLICRIMMQITTATLTDW